MHRAKLPFAAETILDHEIELRAVKGCFAFDDFVRQAHIRGNFLQSCFGLRPILGIAGVFVALRIAHADLHAIFIQTEYAKYVLHEFSSAAEFVLDLLGSAEGVRIVLGETADAGHAAEFARLLVAIDHAEFGETHRQIAIAARLGGVNLDVVRAIHWLQ